MRDLKHVKIILDEINNHLLGLITISARDFHKWTSQVKTYRALIKNLVSDSERKKHLLNNLSTIIHDLQFHDIIEQKTQHIIDINNNVFDLNLGGVKEVFLGHILQMQLLLLSNVQAEYERSSRNIRTMLVSIWGEKTIESEVDKNIDLIFDGAYNFTRKRLAISMLIENIELIKTDVNWKDEKYAVEIEIIRDVFSMKAEREIFDTVFNLEFSDIDSDEIDLF